MLRAFVLGLALMLWGPAPAPAQSFAVEDVTPLINQSAVAWRPVLEITFNEPVRAASVSDSTIQLLGAQRGRVACGFAFSADSTQVSVTPLARSGNHFGADEPVEVRITRGVRSAAGDSLALPWNYHVRTLAIEATGGYDHHLQLDPGYGVVAVEGGHLNGDDKLDLIAPTIIGALSVFINTSPPEGRPLSYQRHDFWIGDSFSTVLLRDFDQDGLSDIAAADQGDDLIRIGINQGDGTSFSWSTLPTCNHPQRLRSGDFDGDGHTDLVFPCQYDENLYVLLGDGQGGFSEPGVYPVLGEWAIDMEARDLDLDGDLDFVVTNELSEELIVLCNNGPHQPLGERFTISDVLPLPAVLGIALEDYDGDRLPDVAAGTLDSARVAICRMLPDCQLADPVYIDTGWGAEDKLRALVSIDFDGDLDHDLAVVDSDAGRWRLLANDGTGAFAVYPQTWCPERPILPLAADLDQDGIVDLAIPGRVEGLVSLFLGIRAVTEVPGDEDPVQVARLHAGPNPFRDQLYLTLPAGAEGRVEIFDVAGRLARRFPLAGEGAPTQLLRWDGRDHSGRPLPAGAYHVRLVTPDGVQATRVIRTR